jgi:hypothetical protein
MIRLAGGLLSVLLAIEQTAGPRVVKGTYSLPAKGFSVVVPPQATGLLKGDPAIERGIRMALPSGGNIVVFGEPNSLEYRTPADGIRAAIATEANCSASGPFPVRVGRLQGAGTRLVCGARVIRYALAFRPGGGPIYWLRLDTAGLHEAEDPRLFEEAKASFRITRWE